VRRGRIRGFVPWLITRRPAVLHKDVLSQDNILVSMKLTTSQNRDAVSAHFCSLRVRFDTTKLQGMYSLLVQRAASHQESTPLTERTKASMNAAGAEDVSAASLAGPRATRTEFAGSGQAATPRNMTPF